MKHLLYFPMRCLIDKEMLNKKQKLWINDYHDKIYKQISPYLNLKERKWLRKKAFKFN